MIMPTEEVFNTYISLCSALEKDKETVLPLIPQGCFLCEYAKATFEEVKGRMGVQCSALNKVVPEKDNDCEEFKLMEI